MASHDWINDCPGAVIYKELCYRATTNECLALSIGILMK